MTSKSRLSNNLNDSNRYKILDPDIFTKSIVNNKNNKLKKFNNKFDDFDDFDDFDNDSDDSNDNETIENSKWKKFDIESESKYKKFNSFINFNNQKKQKQFYNDQQYLNFNSKDIKNKKKLLCNNIITNGSCCYGIKCMYAHSLDEQQIDSNRKLAYEILLSDKILDDINFQQNITIYRSLRELTKLCEKQYCTGGYNCKHGICGNKKLQICSKDLDYGDCSDVNCQLVHLTKRGLKPFYNGYTIKNESIQNKIINIDEIPKPQDLEKIIFISDLGLKDGIVLTSDLIKTFPINSDQIIDETSDISLDSESESADFTDECEQSIFS